MDKIRKDWAVMIALAAVSLLVVLNFSAILTWISEFIGMMFPLILGMILAFILNVPMKRIEQVLEKINFPQKLRRSVAILSIIVILLLIISLLIWIIAPMIAKTVSQLGDSVNHLLFVVADFVQHSKLMQSSEVSQITDSLSQSNIVSSVITFLGGFTTNISGLFSNVFSVIMGIFFMINILASKEMLARLTLRILNVVLPKDKIEHITYVGEVIVDTYDRFLMSQIIEAGIVGVMIFAGYSLVGLPYAGLVGVLSGVLSFIPYIGPFMACGIGMLFNLYRKPNSSTHFTCRLYDRSNSGRKCRLSEGCRQFRWFANDSNPCCCVNRWKSLWFSRNDFLHTNFCRDLPFRERMGGET